MRVTTNPMSGALSRMSEPTGMTRHNEVAHAFAFYPTFDTPPRATDTGRFCFRHMPILEF